MLDCRKCGAAIDDPAGTGRCRFCFTPYRVDPAPMGDSRAPVAAPPGHGVIVVTDVGNMKISVIKVVHTHFKCGLKEAKDLVEQPLPFHVTTDLARVHTLCKDLVEAGARAQIVA
jgi:ribosomal protein L7/L12